MGDALDEEELAKLRHMEENALASITPFLQALFDADANVGEVTDRRHVTLAPAHHVPTMSYREALARETSKPQRLNTVVSTDRAALPTRTATCTYTSYPESVFNPAQPHPAHHDTRAQNRALRLRFQGDPTKLQHMTAAEIDAMHSHQARQDVGREEYGLPTPEQYREPAAGRTLANAHLQSLLDAASAGKAAARRPRPPCIP